MSKEDDKVLALFGSNVMKLRTAAGWSAAELGERSRLGVEKVGQFERGEASATLIEMRKLAAALGVELHVLVGLDV